MRMTRRQIFVRCGIACATLIFLGLGTSKIVENYKAAEQQRINSADLFFNDFIEVRNCYERILPGQSGACSIPEYLLKSETFSTKSSTLLMAFAHTGLSYELDNPKKSDYRVRQYLNTIRLLGGEKYRIA